MAVDGIGIGREYDVPFKIGANLKTTTSQYMAVAMVPGTSTAVDWTVEGASNSATVGVATSTARHAIGICQDALSAGSTRCTVRMFGLSKVICGDSITAGEWICADWGVSATIVEGGVVAVDDAVTCSAATQSITSHVTILGRALEKGSTNTVITAFINPQLYDNNLVASTT